MIYNRRKSILVTFVVIFLLTVSFTAASVVVGQSPSVEAYETATQFRYPLDPGGWFLGQRFGAWNTFRSAYHLAEDLFPSNLRTELPVYTPANGQVRYSGFQSGYGYVVVIEHRLPDSTYVCSVLGHLRRANLIPRGANVVKGQLIGYLSSNPIENGGYNFTHLHFGIRQGPYSTARDWDGRWRYRGYTPHRSIMNLWHHPSNFVDAHSSPAESPRLTGALNVTITPRDAVSAGAQWRITGTSTWRKSGFTLSRIPVGTHTVEFKEIPGWESPANRSITIGNGETALLNASYTGQAASSLKTSSRTLYFSTVRIWSYSSPRSYTVTGENLSGGVSIEAPAGFWISQNYASGYGKTITLQPDRSGSVNQRIYVSFLPTRTGFYSSNIGHSTPGTDTRNLNVMGWGGRR